MRLHESQPRRKARRADMELINRWKSGDGRAATKLVGRHSQALVDLVEIADRPHLPPVKTEGESVLDCDDSQNSCAESIEDSGGGVAWRDDG